MSIAAPVTDEVRDALRARLQQILKDRPDITMSAIAAYTVLSDSVARNFLSGHLKGGSEVISELSRVAHMIEAGEICTPGGSEARLVVDEAPAKVSRVRRNGTFYKTATVSAIYEVLDFCVENCAIGVVTGDFGVGKTEAISGWRRSNSRTDTLVFEFDHFCSANGLDFIMRLANQLEVTPSGRGGKVFRAVCDHLKMNPCLLVFDQCEMTHPRCLQIIRQIWDRTHQFGVGVVLLAAPLLLQKLRVTRIADLGALTSRVGVWAQLRGVSRQEMAAIAKQEGIENVEETAFDLWWRSTGGSMRRLMRAIDLLRAKHQGKPITERTIEQMSGYLWGKPKQAGNES